MECRVRAVGAPAFGARRDAVPLHSGALHRLDEAEVALGKRVARAERAQRDDVRRPRPEAGQGREALLEVVEALRRREEERPVRDGTREGPQRRRACAGKADARDVRLRDGRGPGEDVR